jgi:hypothetical protein
MLNDQSPEAYEFLNKHVHARANGLIQDLLDKNQRNFQLSEEQWYQDLFNQFQESEESIYSNPPEIYHETPLYEDYDPSIEADYCPEDYDPELREPYEFWIVSDFLANKLKDNSALLTNQWGFWIWGRETTGQSILIDYIFQKIWDDFKNKNS